MHKFIGTLIGHLTQMERILRVPLESSRYALFDYIRKIEMFLPVLSTKAKFYIASLKSYYMKGGKRMFVTTYVSPSAFLLLFGGGGGNLCL